MQILKNFGEMYKTYSHYYVARLQQMLQINTS